MFRYAMMHIKFNKNTVSHVVTTQPLRVRDRVSNWNVRIWAGKMLWLTDMNDRSCCIPEVHRSLENGKLPPDPSPTVTAYINNGLKTGTDPFTSFRQHR
jgi:hypothetical protein